MVDERYDRQILFLGEAGHAKIASAHVAIVGLGGLGSHVAQALAYLGVGSFLLVDDDHVEMSNLNRLIGAYPADADAKTLKVEVSERLIKQIKPEVVVLSMPKNLRSRQVLDALSTTPIIFGCVDHDGPRLVLMELSAAYNLTLIDCASEINPGTAGPADFGGRVVVSRPGEYCLSCAGEIDMEIAKQELETPEIQEIRRAHGYGLGEQGKAASVVSLNGVVANLAVTEFLMLVTDIRPPNRHLTYYGLRGIVNKRENARREDCYTCGYLTGKGAEADISRYALD